MKVRWYHFAMLWLAISTAAWRASPLFMAYVADEPPPGSFARYTGTVRFEGTETRSVTGVHPPRYLIRTSAGEHEFHCGFKVYPKRCLFNGSPGLAPQPDDVYTIGSHWYWGVDYMKHPARLAAYDQTWLSGRVAANRKRYADEHVTSAAVLAALLIAHLVLVLRRSPREAREVT